MSFWVLTTLDFNICRVSWHHAPRENKWHAYDSKAFETFDWERVKSLSPLHKLESYYWLTACSDGSPAASWILACCKIGQLESGPLVFGRFWTKARMWKWKSKAIKKRSTGRCYTALNEWFLHLNFYYSWLMTLQRVMRQGLSSIILQNEKNMINICSVGFFLTHPKLDEHLLHIFM